MEMLQILVIATMSFVAHGIGYTACTKEGKYTEKAFACEDKLSAEMCEVLFPYKDDKPPVIDGTDERPDACWSKDKGQSLDKKVAKSAADLCPKRCALCCKSAAFDCKDDNSIDCAKAKKYCKNSVMKVELDLVNKCPKTCGLCEEKNAGCADAAEDCDKSLCFYPGFADVMKKQCKRTCGFCDEASTTPQKATTTTPNGLDCPENNVALPPTATEPSRKAVGRVIDRAKQALQDGTETSADYRITYVGEAHDRFDEIVPNFILDF